MLRCSRYGSTAVEAGGGLGVPERSVLQRALEIEPEASLPQIFLRIVVIELDHVELAGQMAVIHSVKGHRIRTDGGFDILFQYIRHLLVLYLFHYYHEYV